MPDATLRHLIVGVCTLGTEMIKSAEWEKHCFFDAPTWADSHLRCKALPSKTHCVHVVDLVRTRATCRLLRVCSVK